LFVGKEFESLNPGTIIVEAETIREIRKGVIPGGVDLGGAFVIPAFINGHCHLGDSGIKELGVGLPVEEAVSPPNGLKHRYLGTLSSEDLISGIRQGLKEMVHQGITLCADFREGGIEGVRALRKASQNLPIKVLVLGRPLYSESDPRFMEEVLLILDEADGLGISSSDQFSPHTIRTIRKIAGKKILAVHALEAPFRGSPIKKNILRRREVKRILESNFDLLIHLTQAKSEDILKFQDAGMRAVSCGRTNGILGDGIPPVDLFEKSGMTWGIGSDNMMFTSPDLFRELDYMSRSLRGLRKQSSCLKPELLKNATWMGAEALGLGESYGVLEAGYSASFIGLNPSSDAFQFSRNILSSITHRAGSEDISFFISSGLEAILPDGPSLF
jgi:cytosine/adenosine deaminase-related metal-dependent hydrolase